MEETASGNFPVCGHRIADKGKLFSRQKKIRVGGGGGRRGCRQMRSRIEGLGSEWRGENSHCGETKIGKKGGMEKSRQLRTKGVEGGRKKTSTMRRLVWSSLKNGEGGGKNRPEEKNLGWAEGATGSFSSRSRRGHQREGLSTGGVLVELFRRKKTGRGQGAEISCAFGRAAWTRCRLAKEDEIGGGR